MRKIAHIINPFSPAPGSDLDFVQPITIESMKIAKGFAHGLIEVTQLTAQFPEDRAIIPDGFTETQDLDRSILDVRNFEFERKLPLLVDILDRLYNNSAADYLVYSNMDIALMPYFYVAVDRLIESGLDAFVINRRTISDQYQTIAEIPLMFEQVGEPHEGHDCFIFHRQAYPKYKLGLACIGIPWVGRILLWNLIQNAGNFTEIKDSHLTFHLGNDLAWDNALFDEYEGHNKSEMVNVLNKMVGEANVIKEDHPLYPYVLDINYILNLNIKNPRKLRILVIGILQTFLSIIHKIIGRLEE